MNEDKADNQGIRQDISPAEAVQPAPQTQEPTPQAQEKPIVLWKDMKFLAGFILVVSSIIIGFFAKGIIVVNITQPFPLIKGLSIYALSWALLFIGIFLVGMETVRMIQQKIHYHVKKSVKDTYGYTKKLPKGSIEYTKKLHRKSIDRLAKTSKFIKRKMRHENG